MRVQIDENWVTLTPFGSLIRANPAKLVVLSLGQQNFARCLLCSFAIRLSAYFTVC
jgi:hypothetical protein